MYYEKEKMNTRENKRIVRLATKKIKTALSEHIFKKTSTFTLGARSLLLIHIRFTPSEGPKNFVNCFF